MIESSDEVAARTVAEFRTAFAVDLVARRKARRHTPRSLANLSHIRLELYEKFEAGTLRPRWLPLKRLAEALDVTVFVWLEEVAVTVRPRGLTHLPFTAEAIMLYEGVTPEQMLRIESPASGTPAPPKVPDFGDKPLGPAVRHTRVGHPLRVQAAHQLRREYERSDRPGIGAIARQHQMSFATCRTLLIEADTPLRGPGNPNFKA